MTTENFHFWKFRWVATSSVAILGNMVTATFGCFGESIICQLCTVNILFPGLPILAMFGIQKHPLMDITGLAESCQNWQVNILVHFLRSTMQVHFPLLPKCGHQLFAILQQCAKASPAFDICFCSTFDPSQGRKHCAFFLSLT